MFCSKKDKKRLSFLPKSGIRLYSIFQSLFFSSKLCLVMFISKNHLWFSTDARKFGKILKLVLFLPEEKFYQLRKISCQTQGSFKLNYYYHFFEASKTHSFSNYCAEAIFLLHYFNDNWNLGKKRNLNFCKIECR